MRIHSNTFSRCSDCNLRLTSNWGYTLPAVSAETCPNGLVWAERWEGDTEMR